MGYFCSNLSPKDLKLRALPLGVALADSFALPAILHFCPPLLGKHARNILLSALLARALATLVRRPVFASA